MLKRLVVRIALIVAVLFTPIGASAGDAVTDWNQIALAATTTANQGPIPQNGPWPSFTYPCTTR
jgi:hypothetical protein